MLFCQRHSVRAVTLIEMMIYVVVLGVVMNLATMTFLRAEGRLPGPRGESWRLHRLATASQSEGSLTAAL